GVVGDHKFYSLTDQGAAVIYAPYQQSLWPFTCVAVRTAVDPSSLVSAVRNEIHALDKDQPVVGFKTMEQVRDQSLGQPRFSTQLIGTFAAVAVLLATLGIYGVISYSVIQRMHEIGIRLALGARICDVVKLVVGQGVKLA